MKKLVVTGSRGQINCEPTFENLKGYIKLTQYFTRNTVFIEATAVAKVNAVRVVIPERHETWLKENPGCDVIPDAVRESFIEHVTVIKKKSGDVTLVRENIGHIYQLIVRQGVIF